MQNVNCEEIHSGRLQMTAAYKAFVTTVIRTFIFYPHIRT